MNPTQPELDELRQRVLELERKVAELQSTRSGAETIPPPLPPIIATTATPVAATPSLELEAASRSALRDVPSTIWVAAAGAFIFLVGTIYGLVVSIERGWISPPVRVTAGICVSLLAGYWAGKLLLAQRKLAGITLLAVAAGTWTFSLYFGAHEAHLFPLGLGFGGAAVATLMCGALSARVRSDAAMAVAISTGLVAPLAFSSGEGTVAGLSLYLVVLVVAQMVACYATNSGGAWRSSRALSFGALWLVAVIGAEAANLGQIEAAFVALGALFAAVLALVWLPRHSEKPWGLTIGTVASFIGFSLASWQVWRRADWDREFFSIVLVALAALAVAGVSRARLRLSSTAADIPLFLLAAGFGLLSIPVAVSWRWVALAWGLGALLLALGQLNASKRQLPVAGALGWPAFVAVFCATLVWLMQSEPHNHHEIVFLNPVFFGAMLTAGAWSALAVHPTKWRALAFAAAQFVLINAIAWEIAAALPVVHGEEASLAIGAVAATLIYAASGSALWLRGVIYEPDVERARALRISGYGWLVVAAGKLLLRDMADADLAFRAVAALGVGAVFIAAALWADRHRARSNPSP